MNLASFGRCSLILMPGDAVSISLNGPPLAWPGLRSKVSIWLGPPFIHSRMHDRLRCGFCAVVVGQRFEPAGHRKTQDAGRGQPQPFTPRETIAYERTDIDRFLPWVVRQAVSRCLNGWLKPPAAHWMLSD